MKATVNDSNSISRAGVRHHIGGVLLCLAFSVFLCGCSPEAPLHANAWLSYKYGTANCGAYSNPPGDLNGSTAILSQNCPGLSDFNEATNYYNDIAAPATLASWKATYGFPVSGNPPARGLYANNLDLRIGRDMNCVQNGPQIACYVTNYGPPPEECFEASNETNCPWPRLETAVNDAIAGNNPFASVAMVYSGVPNGTNGGAVNNITFYVYDASGNLSPYAALDGEGAKSVPRMCMGCHGGFYTPHTNSAKASVAGASFLPFDVPSFYYSKANPSQGYDQQQEAFRLLNLLVKTANGGSQPKTAQQTAIVDFINGLYCPDTTNGASAIAVFLSRFRVAPRTTPMFRPSGSETRPTEKYTARS